MNKSLPLAFILFMFLVHNNTKLCESVNIIVNLHDFCRITEPRKKTGQNSFNFDKIFILMKNLELKCQFA